MITKSDKEVIGLLPAGGIATRIAPLPCSKELYPVGFSFADDGHNLRPKVVCHYLLKKMQLAGIKKAYIVLRKGKWDIPSYLGDGTILNMHLAYLMVRLPFGAPYTLDQAYPFVKEALVALGFPDIIFLPDDAFVRLLDQQSSTDADVVLGIFYADQPQKMDMVDIDKGGRVCDIVIKPSQTHLKYTWIIAVWTPAFTRFMHEYLQNTQDIHEQKGHGRTIQIKEELYVGDLIREAIRNGMQVEAVLFPDGKYIDIGTPDNLIKAVRSFSSMGGGLHDYC
jgi:glucose-1-phosphate thymidylyltransferase